MQYIFIILICAIFWMVIFIAMPTNHPKQDKTLTQLTVDPALAATETAKKMTLKSPTIRRARTVTCPPPPPAFLHEHFPP
jgi:hypothetical protein